MIWASSLESVARILPRYRGESGDGQFGNILQKMTAYQLDSMDRSMSPLGTVVGATVLISSLGSVANGGAAEQAPTPDHLPMWRRLVTATGRSLPPQMAVVAAMTRRNAPRVALDHEVFSGGGTLRDHFRQAVYEEKLHQWRGRHKGSREDTLEGFEGYIV
jgi:hypothetical protein